MQGQKPIILMQVLCRKESYLGGVPPTPAPQYGYSFLLVGAAVNICSCEQKEKKKERGNKRCTKGACIKDEWS